MNGSADSQNPATSPQARPQSTTLASSASQWLRMWKPAAILGTPAAMFTGVMMLFVYLAHIDRLDLLQQVVASSSGLVLIVMWAVITSLSLTIMFFGSLWIIDIAASTYAPPKHIPQGMAWLLSLGSVGWYGLVVAMFLFHFSNNYIVIGMLAYMILLAGTGAAIQYRARSGSEKRFAMLASGGFVGFLFAFAMLLSLYAPLAFLLVEPTFGKQKVELWPTILLVGTSAPELLLGCIMFRGFTKGQQASEVRKRAMLGVVAFAFLGLITIIRPIDMLVLHALGVYSHSDEAIQFAVASDNLTPSLKATGFTVASEPDGAEVFGAIVRFRFGRQLVLCVEQDASRSTNTPAEATKKVAPTNHTTPLKPLSEKPDKKSTVKTDFASPKQCIDLHTDDVRRLSQSHSKLKQLANS